MCSIGANIHNTLLVHLCAVFVEIYIVHCWCIGVQYWWKYTKYIIGASVCSIGANTHSTILVHWCAVLVQIYTVHYWCIGGSGVWEE